jgi:hypothetical protein
MCRIIVGRLLLLTKGSLLKIDLPIVVLTAVTILASSPLRADISGRVVDATSGDPIGGAFVHVRADGGASGVHTLADGTFTVPVVSTAQTQIAVSVPYNRAAAINYLIGGGTFAGDTSGVVISLQRLSATDVPNYTPASSVSCSGCHPSIYASWSMSNHARAARNEWVMDLYSGNGTAGGGAGYLFRSSHPGKTGFCATCHTPMAEVRNPGSLFLDEVTEPGALEGVNCVSCHQLDSIDTTHLNALHLLGKSTYRFPNDLLPASSYVWGRLDDVTYSGMPSLYSPLHEQSLICASCHQYDSPFNGISGQHTYTEWQASSYAIAGPGYRSCQDCHMPPATTPDPLCVQVANDRPAEQRRDHVIVGSTPAMLQGFLTLTAVATETVPGRIRVTADVRNLAGHGFPTGIAIRNAILVVTARHRGADLAQISGPTIPFWGSDEVPGIQPGDLAGLPGKGFAKVLEGRINGTGAVVRPVMFFDAEAVFSDTAIPAGATDTTVVEFQLAPGVSAGTVVDVEVRLLYRRVFRSFQVSKGWSVSAHGGPIEIEVATRQLQVVTQQESVGIPALTTTGLAALALAFVLAGLAVLTRARS